MEHTTNYKFLKISVMGACVVGIAWMWLTCGEKRLELNAVWRTSQSEGRMLLMLQTSVQDYWWNEQRCDESFAISAVRCRLRIKN